MKVEFHPEASAEFQAASAYYEKEVPGLGEAFISEVERVAELIGVHPAIGNPIDEIFRRVVLLRFPLCCHILCCKRKVVDCCCFPPAA